MFSSSPENLLQNSVDESWTDTNLNRVSVIQFLDDPKGDEDEESGAERRVRDPWRVVGSLGKPRGKLSFPEMGATVVSMLQADFPSLKPCGALRTQAGEKGN